MKRFNRRCLVLNADYMPINTRHWTQAFSLMLKGKATQVDFYSDDVIRDGHSRQYPVPAVIALNKYVRRNYQKAPFSKVNVFARDHYQCQYCGVEHKANQLTMDHVIPKSKWSGEPSKSTCWTNIVTACISCNAKKADKSCHEADMFPLNPPAQPGYDEIFFGFYFHGKVEKEWIRWLSVFDSFSRYKVVNELYTG